MNEFRFNDTTDIVTKTFENIHQSYRDPTNEDEDGLSIFLKAFGKAFAQKGIETATEKTEAFRNKLNEFAYSSWQNSLMKHKGGGEDAIDFFRKSSTYNSWINAQIAGTDPSKPTEMLENFSKRKNLEVFAGNQAPVLTENAKKLQKKLLGELNEQMNLARVMPDFFMNEMFKDHPEIKMEIKQKFVDFMIGYNQKVGLETFVEDLEKFDKVLRDGMDLFAKQMGEMGANSEDILKFTEVARKLQSPAKDLLTGLKINPGFPWSYTVDHKTGSIFISFPALGDDAVQGLLVGDKGKNILGDIMTDYKYRPNGGKVSSIAAEIYDTYRPAIIKMLENSPYKNVNFAGHSLGGAITTLAANDVFFEEKGFSVVNTTFGSPAIGDATFAKNYGQFVEHNRIIHSSDVVATIGRFRHVTDEVWDIAEKGVNFFTEIDDFDSLIPKSDKLKRRIQMLKNQGKLVDAEKLARKNKKYIKPVQNAIKKVHEFLDYKLGLERVDLDFVRESNVLEGGDRVVTFDSYVDLTHRSAGFDLYMKAVADGEIDLSQRAAGDFVSYPRARAIANIIKTKAIYNNIDRLVLAKYAIIETKSRILNFVDDFADGPMKTIMENSKKAMQKAGYVFGTPGRIRIRMNQFTTDFKFDTSVLNSLKREPAIYDKLVQEAVEGIDINDILLKTNEFDSIDDVFSKRSLDLFSELDYTKARNQIAYLAQDAISARQFNHVVPTMTKFRSIKEKIAKDSKKATQKVLKKTEKVSIFIEESEASKAARELAERIKKDVATIREIINKNIGVKTYANLDDANIKKSVKPTLLTKKFANFSDTTKKFYNKNFATLLENTISIKGISGIKKGLTASKKVTQKVVDSAVDLMRKLVNKSSKFGVKASKMFGKLKTIATKEIPIVGTALEIGFTASEIDADLERIENEKEFVIWNGEVIFKEYNPDEYAEINALNIIYNTQDIDKKVSFDTFLNTWYGRLSTDENGVLIIDGVRTDDPDFDNVYTKTVTAIRGEDADYETDSKTLSVIKNVGLAIFNIAMDVSSFVSTGAGVAAGIATGVIDEIFEQQAQSKRENGFTRALKFKLLNDSYHQISEYALEKSNLDKSAKQKMIDYLNAHVREAHGVTLPDPNGNTKSAEDLRNELLELGFDEDALDDSIRQINEIERIYNDNPSVAEEIAKFIAMAPMNGLHDLGTFVGQKLGQIAGNTKNGVSLETYLNSMRSATDVYLNLRDKISRHKSKKWETTVDGVKQKFEEKDVFRNYNSNFQDQVYLYTDLLDAKLEFIEKMYKDGTITMSVKNILGAEAHEDYEMNLKVLDVLTVSNASDYFEDPGVKDIVKAFNEEQLKIAKIKRDQINETLIPLLQKHSAAENGENMELKMKLEIKKAEIRQLLKQAGYKEDHQLADLMLNAFLNNNRDIFPLKEGEVSTTVDEEYIKDKIGRARLNRAINDWETSENLQLGNIIREEYLFITKIMDVFYDPRSIYKNEPDVIKYYQEQGIEIDIEKRQQEATDFEVKRNVLGHLDKVFFEIFSENEDVTMENYMKLKDFEIPEEYRETITILRGIVDMVKNKGDGSIEGGFHHEFDFEYEVAQDYGEGVGTKSKGKLTTKFKINQTKGNTPDRAQTFTKTHVLSEREQFDLGFADDDGKDNVKFEPSGKILPFTMDNGPPRMLFENGKEKSYTGPTNALKGGIEQGYWTGVIPNGQHAPISILDNYFMAYHIENQENPKIAKGRFMARVKQAMSNGSISQEKNYVEFQMALYTIAYLERNEHLYGLEMSNQFMSNGLGATINSQLREEVGPDARKGVLPNNVDDRMIAKMEIEEEIDEKNVLKRAADFAKEIGDETMALQFDRISKSSAQMKRIADEYIGNIRKKQRSVNQGEEYIGSGIDRLILEKSVQSEDLKEKYTKLIVESLGKQLFEFI